jgi:hypothetical protein
MMIVPADGSLALMGFLTRGIALNPFCGLFVNNVFPDFTFNLGSFVEASFVGYARKPVGLAVGVAALPGGGARVSFAPINFTGGVGAPDQTCYGYFMVQLDWVLTPRLLWCERMAPTATMPAPIQNLSVTSVFDFSSLFV